MFSLANKIESKTDKRFDLIRVHWRLKCACNAYIIDAEIESCTNERICKFTRLRTHKLFCLLGGSHISCEFDLKTWCGGLTTKWSQPTLVSV